MRERVAHYRGVLDIRSRPRAGTRITVTIPLAAEAWAAAAAVGAGAAGRTV